MNRTVIGIDVGGTTTKIVGFRQNKNEAQELKKLSEEEHEKVIELIHMMGASDFYITIQFAVRSFKLTLIGSIVGFLLALPIMMLFNYFLQGMTAGFVIQNTLTPIEWLILISVPFLTAALSFLTAYKTVSKTLKQTL